ncbi:hypothetical protein Plhal304r1_c093g0172731 [Plasmopara halstedii]
MIFFPCIWYNSISIYTLQFHTHFLAIVIIHNQNGLLVQIRILKLRKGGVSGSHGHLVGR